MNSSLNPSVASLNLVQIFLDRARLYANRAALLYKEAPGGRYRSISWNEWADRIRKTAYGLYHLGVRKGERVGILSENRPEWTMADLGILSLGAVTVPIYPTSSCRDISYILENAGIEVLFFSSDIQYEKIAELLDSPRLKKIVAFDSLKAPHSKLVRFDWLLDCGRREMLNNSDLYLQRVRDVTPDDLATIIYTSGTTGPPKGVMLTHQNFVENVLGASGVIPISEEDVALSFLPLSHIFERLAGYYFMAFHGAPIAYAESMQAVADDFPIVRPTVAAAVPRFYEKVYAKILENVEAAPPLAQKIFAWSRKVGGEMAKRRMNKEAISAGLCLKYAAAKILVFHKIKKKLGGRLRFFISGGAPLAKELAEFFFAADILILEGYGLTETSPVITANSPENFRFGTVGRAISNAEVKIAEDGEILTRGPCVMKGYYQNEAATREAMEGGWFHTGDIGAMDEDGFLKITDRKKDIIVTSGGKKASPQNIENLLLGDTLFSQVVVVGDKRNYLVALVVPNRHEVERFAAEKGLSLPYPELLKNDAVMEWVDRRLGEKTKELAPFEQIKYFALLEQDLSQEKGELTPTLKVKRKVIMEKYRDVIEGLYQKGNPREDKKESPAFKK